MKQRKTFALIAVALLALLPLAAIAEPGDRDRHRGRGPGRGMFPPPGYLDLSDEQIDAAEAIRESARAEMGAAREETGTLRDALKTMLESDSPNAAEVGQLVIDLHGLRQQTRATLEDAESQFAALLTAEQLEKWENFKELRKGRRGPGRHRGQPERGQEGPAFGAGFGAGADRSGPIG